MKRFKVLLTLALGVLLAFPAAALAKPQVSIAMTAEKEIVVKEDGKEVIRRIPAGEITPGEIIIYTLRYANAGDEPATSVAVNNPVPEGTAYVEGSATAGDSRLTFSIDGGKTFAAAAQLTYQVPQANGGVETRLAPAEMYTHIRWNIPEIPAGSQGVLGFRVRVK